MWHRRFLCCCLAWRNKSCVGNVKQERAAEVISPFLMCIHRGSYRSLHENPLMKTGADAALLGEWSAMIVLINAYPLRQNV